MSLDTRVNTYDHEGLEQTKLGNHRREALRSSETDDVLSAHDNSHGSTWIRREHFCSKRSASDKDRRKGELEKSPACL